MKKTKTPVLKVTIHRALSELKLIDSKIEKQINEILPVGIYQKGKLIENRFAEKQFAETAQSKYNSVVDLIARKSKIKSAIVAANGKTKMTVAGKSMTIADAINTKAAIEFKKQLINKLKAGLQTAVAMQNKNNAIVQENLQSIIKALVGKDNANAKSAADAVDVTSKTYMAANEFHLADPLKVQDKIDALEKETSDFLSEVDASLSEINAVTFIEI